MSGAKAARKRQSLWGTLLAASGSYRRLYGYVKPYRMRFLIGLGLGLAYGGVTSLFPLAIARVTSTVFHGAAPNPMAVRSNLHVLDTGPKINSIVLICLAIPAIMAVRSLCSYGSTYCMQWVSNRVVSDIRVQLFSKMVRHSMDFFNKMRSGFLMSRITNDTRVIKSFAREGFQEKEFKRSNQLQFSQMMRMIRSMEAVGPLVEIIAAIGVGMALLYVYAANLSVGRFFGLISGIFILYDPIKT